MPPLYAYEAREIKQQVGKGPVPIIKTENAVEGKEYYCGCMECDIDAKVVFRKGKFVVKYGDSKNHSKLCKSVNRFLRQGFDESGFAFENAMKELTAM